MPKIELTKSQIENLKDFFDYEFINGIRNDTEIDNMSYLVDMCEIYKKLKEADENDNG